MKEYLGPINTLDSVVTTRWVSSYLTWANISEKPTITIITYGTEAPNNSDGNPEGSIYFRISS
jgi:hypothetical protein